MRDLVLSIWEAIRVTRWFFTPFDARKWGVVALAVVFVGARAGYGSVTNAAVIPFFDGGIMDETVPPAARLVDLVTSEIFVVGVVALGVVTFLGAVAEFVLIDVLRKDEARMREFTTARLGVGARLFVFRAAATVAVFAVSAPAGFALFEVGVSGAGTVFAVLILVAVAVSVVNGLTTDFVAPVMVREGCGVVEGWRRFYGVLSENVGIFSVYVVARVLVNVGIGVGVVVGSVIVGWLTGTTVEGIGFVMSLVGNESTAATGVGLVLAVVIFAVYVVLLVATVALFFQLPVRIFVRSWSIFLLGRIEPRYALIDEPPETVLSLRPPP